MADLFASLACGTSGSVGSFYDSPFNTYFHDQRLQYIVTKADLNAIGISGATILKGIALKPYEIPGMNMVSVRVRMKETTVTTLTAWETTGLTEVESVFTLSKTSLTVGAWYEFLFTTNFTWSGNNNLLIEISRDGTAYSGTAGGHYTRTGLASGRSAGAHSDSGGTYPFDTLPVTTYAHIPDTQFRYTPSTTPATVSSIPATAITTSTATIGGNVSATGGENPTRYLYWGTTDGGTTAGSWGNTVNLGTGGTGDFTTNITGLTPGTTYYFRAYASNSAGGTWAGSTLSFTATKLSQSAPATPTYSSLSYHSVVLSCATAGAQIVCNGQTKASGSVWSGLTDGTQYTAYAYLPADATHSQSANSGNLTFTTLDVTFPTVSVPASTPLPIPITFSGGAGMATVTVQSSYFDATAVSGIYETDTYEGNVYAGDQTTVSQDYTYAATINHSGIPITVTQVTLHIIVTAADGTTHDYGNYEVAISDSVAPTIQSIEISPDPATVGASVLIKVRVVD